MKINETIEQVKLGKIMAIGYFVSAKGRNVGFNDKRTGQRRSMPIVEYNLVLGGQVSIVREILEDGQDAEKFVEQHRLKPMAQVVVELRSLQSDKGVYRADGKVHPVTD